MSGTFEFQYIFKIIIGFSEQAKNRLPAMGDVSRNIYGSKMRCFSIIELDKAILLEYKLTNKLGKIHL
jgi:hypothetical protein